MAKSTEEQPEAVPARAIRAGEILLRWGWVEPLVWTKRMLTALEQGVKGDQFFADRGFYSLKRAYELACQSSSR
jgi:RNA-directed DNA polymerase